MTRASEDWRREKEEEAGCNVGDDPTFRETADGQSDCCDVAGHQDPGSHPEAPALPSLPLSHTTIHLIALARGPSPSPPPHRHF